MGDGTPITMQKDFVFGSGGTKFNRLPDKLVEIYNQSLVASMCPLNSYIHAAILFAESIGTKSKNAASYFPYVRRFVFDAREMGHKNIVIMHYCFDLGMFRSWIHGSKVAPPSCTEPSFHTSLNSEAEAIARAAAFRCFPRYVVFRKFYVSNMIFNTCVRHFLASRGEHSVCELLEIFAHTAYTYVIYNTRLVICMTVWEYCVVKHTHLIFCCSRGCPRTRLELHWSVVGQYGKGLGGRQASGLGGPSCLQGCIIHGGPYVCPLTLPTHAHPIFLELCGGHEFAKIKVM